MHVQYDVRGLIPTSQTFLTDRDRDEIDDRHVRSIVAREPKDRHKGRLMSIAGALAAEYKPVRAPWHVLCASPFALAYGGPPRFPAAATNPSEILYPLFPLVANSDVDTPKSHVVVYEGSLDRLTRLTRAREEAEAARRLVEFDPPVTIEELLNSPDSWLPQSRGKWVTPPVRGGDKGHPDIQRLKRVVK